MNISNIRGGVFSIPTAMSNIAKGEYHIQSADTGTRLAIQIEDGRVSGLRAPLVILGAEEGDIVRLFLDRQRRQAEINFSDEAIESASDVHPDPSPTTALHLADQNRLNPEVSAGVTQSDLDTFTRNEINWAPTACAPVETDVEVRLEDSSGRYALSFPCKLLPDGVWVNSWLKTPLAAVPVEWREWTEPPLEL